MAGVNSVFRTVEEKKTHIVEPREPVMLLHVTPSWGQQNTQYHQKKTCVRKQVKESTWRTLEGDQKKRRSTC